MPAPEPGGYTYPPDGTTPGAPEVFTAWAFVFNFPDQCTADCDGDDLGDTPAQGGVYRFDGRVSTGDTLLLHGLVSVGQPAGPPGIGVPLQSPGSAEVHVAVAPHGQLDAANVVAQLTTPVGSPECDCWWVAFFKDPNGTAGVRAAPAETADLMNQGLEGVYASGAVGMTRGSNRLSLTATFPVPPAGGHVYPAEGTTVGAPEIYTAWAFVFNYPDKCSDECGLDDMGSTPAVGGAYRFDGQVATGDVLHLSGDVFVGQPAGPPGIGVPLESPATAEVHVAIAPHGQLDPAAVVAQLTTPIGSPECDCWWVGFLKRSTQAPAATATSVPLPPSAGSGGLGAGTSGLPTWQLVALGVAAAALLAGLVLRRWSMPRGTD